MNITKYSIPVVIVFLFSVNLFSADKFESKKEIDALLTAYYDFQYFNGSVLVADESGIIFEKGYGMANAEFGLPNGSDIKFRLGSITKQFTAAVILKLLEEKKLSLQDKISDHLDYYRKDNGEKITIHNLLTHTSGIPEYLAYPNFGREYIRDPYEVQPFIEKFCSEDLQFEPGSQWSYSNSGYFILGAIIEEVTGMTYEEALHEYVLDPAGLKDTGYDHTEVIIPNRASGYDRLVDGFRNASYIDMSLPYSAGALYSTVNDLYKWDRILYTGHLLSDESKELMFTGYYDARGAEYGYGWGVSTNYEPSIGDTVKTVSHGGGINGFNTLITRRLNDKILVVLLNNTSSAPLRDISNSILSILDGMEFEYPKRAFHQYLYSLIIDEGSDYAYETYKGLKETGELSRFMVSENELNNLGYFLMNKGNTGAAVSVFRINVDEYPESWNVYDSMGEALLKQGEKEKGIKYYKKSIEMNPRNFNGIEVLKNLGIEVEAPPEISLPADVLSQYTGKYQLAPEFFVDVLVRGNQIFARATGQQEFEIYPESETKFFYKVVDAQIEFRRDETGKLTGLILYQGGRAIPGNKVE